jgi:signal transduction histidine kinase
MNNLVDVVLNDLEYEIAQKQATISVPKLFTFTGHQRQLQQAFQNLIGNSLKYARPGIPVQITIDYTKIKGNDTGLLVSSEELQQYFHVISIRDNGIGFDQEDAERIFNVFTRLHGNAQFPGTGVGLSIVRKVINNHNGYIIAEAKADEGAVFKVYLPA